ncbi:MAG: hypothetical protein O3C51_01725, partial [Planctomycetota bacterium]|nr:hypothetical protein [Planctomycetota bacterium]
MPTKASATEPRRIPKLSRHSSGQARVTLNGKVHYCGKWGTPEAYARYAELLQAWQARGEVSDERVPDPVQATLRLRDLFQQFLDFVDTTGRYQKGGKSTTQRGLYANVARELCRFAGDIRVSSLTAAVLVRWRDELERNTELSVGGINRKVGLAKSVLDWGHKRGLVPAHVLYETSQLRNLRQF